MELPKKIDPCPIVDALVEIRFSTKINPNAVFGVIYSVLEKHLGEIEKLPILELPDQIRSSDPSLKYRPHYKSASNGLIIQIGPNVLTISSHPEYIGWQAFSEKIFDLLEELNRGDIIERVERLGIRYINFFENDIYEEANLQVNIKNEPIAYNNTVIRTEISQGNYSSTLQVANNASNSGQNGSVIDIDTHINTGLDTFFHDKKVIINEAHEKEKKLFFSLLKPEFLNSLNPKY